MQSVAVVGGGIIGLSVAWRLAQVGYSVSVFEKARIGMEASWAAAGMLSPGGEFQEDSPLARMAIESRDLYRAFVEELQSTSGLAIDFQEAGALDVAYSAEEMEVLSKRAERQATIGIPTKRISEEQAATFWPRLRKEGLVGGYFYPGDGLVDPRHMTAALKVSCEKAGVKISEQTEVRYIDLDGSGVTVDELRHDAVVIACGAWSGNLNVTGLPALPATEPIRGHMLGYKQPEQICHSIVRRDHTYMVQRANGYFIVGASTESAGFNRSIDQSTIADLEKKAAFLMPHLSETSPTEVWNGLRPGSDELRVGQWHSERVYLAYGHHRNGILLAPATARRLTKEISANLQTQ